MNRVRKARHHWLCTGAAVLHERVHRRMPTIPSEVSSAASAQPRLRSTRSLWLAPAGAAAAAGASAPTLVRLVDEGLHRGQVRLGGGGRRLEAVERGKHLRASGARSDHSGNNAGASVTQS